MTAFDRAWERTVLIEGDFSDDPNDRGGQTRYGITERVARAHGYTGEMAQLPIELACQIGKAQYWDTLRLDEIAYLSERVAGELFDTGYNTGIGIAGRFFQRCLNALNKGGSLYPDLTVDGLIGPLTVHTFRTYFQRRGTGGETVLLRALNGLQCARYVEIAEDDKSQEAFVYGWISMRVIV